MPSAQPQVQQLTLSIISHGHGAQVGHLLQQLAALGSPLPQRVLVTFNRSEPQHQRALRALPLPFELHLLENRQPLGFGANHNRAFCLDRQLRQPADAFCLVNPDIVLMGNPLGLMMDRLRTDPRIGAVCARQLDDAGRLQDHRRLLPTPLHLLRRQIGRRPGAPVLELGAQRAPDWFNAAFLMVRSSAWLDVGGFDERYHMYCEDIDLCLRLQLAGWALAEAERAQVRHAGQRASHRSLRHLVWHLRSLLRLWCSRSYREYRRARSHGKQPLGAGPDSGEAN